MVLLALITVVFTEYVYRYMPIWYGGLHAKVLNTRANALIRAAPDPCLT